MCQCLEYNLGGTGGLSGVPHSNLKKEIFL